MDVYCCVHLHTAVTAWRVSSHVGSPYELGLDGDRACDKQQRSSRNKADRNIGVSEETVSVEIDIVAMKLLWMQHIQGFWLK